MKRREFLAGAIGAGAAVAAAPLLRHVPALPMKAFTIPPQATAALPINNPAFRVGDMITIAGKYALNPKTGESTGRLKFFMVTRIEDGNAVLQYHE